MTVPSPAPAGGSGLWTVYLLPLAFGRYLCRSFRLIAVDGYRDGGLYDRLDIEVEAALQLVEADLIVLGYRAVVLLVVL